MGNICVYFSGLTHSFNNFKIFTSEYVSICTSMSPTRHPSPISIYISICLSPSIFSFSLISRTHEHIHISRILSHFNPICACKYISPQAVALLTSVLVHMSLVSFHNPNPSPVSSNAYTHRAMYQWPHPHTAVGPLDPRAKPSCCSTSPVRVRNNHVN